MRKLFGVATLFSAVFLGACEADPAFVLQTAPPVVGSTFFIGSGSGLNFLEGDIDITNLDIPAMGSTNLQVSVVDVNLALYTTPVTVSFTSNCATAGTAIIDPTPTNTVDGIASTTYTDAGCIDEDTITATATVEGQVLEATGVVTIIP